MQELKVVASNIEGNVLTVLTGKAVDPKAPNVVDISGDIHSVAAFIKGRIKNQAAGLQIANHDRAVIIVDKFNKKITL